MFIPQFILVAAMTHPRQKANTFLSMQFHIPQSQNSTLPMKVHVNKILIARRRIRKLEEKTPALFPCPKAMIQRMLNKFENAKAMWVFALHLFLKKLTMTTTARVVQMTAQIMKKKPGGVTNKRYLSDMLPVSLPTKQLMATVAANPSTLTSLIGHINFPSMPNLLPLSSSLLLFSIVNCSFIFDFLILLQYTFVNSNMTFDQNPTRKNQKYIRLSQISYKPNNKYGDGMQSTIISDGAQIQNIINDGMLNHNFILIFCHC